ncbi:MAG: hypothetical protein KF688_10755 [Pirellulales bacterium]|nr:hypothetical protein [Pirellulales bacterium]
MPRKPWTSNRTVAAVGVLALALVWGAALPRIATRCGYARAIDDLVGVGVEPNAMYYTEHPGAATWRRELLRVATAASDSSGG